MKKWKSEEKKEKLKRLLQDKLQSKTISKCSVFHSTNFQVSPNSCTLQSFSPLLAVLFSGDSKNSIPKTKKRTPKGRNHQRKIDITHSLKYIDKFFLINSFFQTNKMNLFKYNRILLVYSSCVYCKEKITKEKLSTYLSLNPNFGPN